MLRKKASMHNIVKPYDITPPEDFVENKLSEMEDYILNSEIDNEYLVRVGLWFRKMFYFVIPAKGKKGTGVPLKDREKLVPLFEALNERFSQGQVPPKTSRFVLARSKEERWLSKAVFGSTKYSLWHTKDNLLKEIRRGQTPFAEEVQILLNQERDFSDASEKEKFRIIHNSNPLELKSFCSVSRILNAMPIFYSRQLERFCSGETTKRNNGMTTINKIVRPHEAKWTKMLNSYFKTGELEIPEEIWKPYENEIKSYAWGFRSWTTTVNDPSDNRPSMANIQFLAMQLGSEGANNQGDAFFFHYETDPQNYIMSANDFLDHYMEAFKEYEANLTEEERASSGMSSLQPNSYFPFDYNEVLLNIPNLNFNIKKIILRESWYDVYIQ